MHVYEHIRLKNAGQMYCFDQVRLYYMLISYYYMLFMIYTYWQGIKNKLQYSLKTYWKIINHFPLHSKFIILQSALKEVLIECLMLDCSIITPKNVTLVYQGASYFQEPSMFIIEFFLILKIKCQWIHRLS